jgi:hypothetical protein
MGTSEVSSSWYGTGCTSLHSGDAKFMGKNGKAPVDHHNPVTESVTKLWLRIRATLITDE